MLLTPANMCDFRLFEPTLKKTLRCGVKEKEDHIGKKREKREGGKGGVDCEGGGVGTNMRAARRR